MRARKPETASRLPSCPRMLKGEGRKEWARVTAILAEQGRLSALDRAALSMYCQAWARWIEAEKQIAETGGAVVKSPNGYPIQNPWLSTANAAFKQTQIMLRQLGLSSAARKRTKTTRPATSAGPRGLQILSPGA
jgi:P27 family predicted phage terminase small subunit